MPKDKKKKKDKSFAEKLREALTFFNPGATAIEQKVTPGIQSATKAAKKSIKGK